MRQFGSMSNTTESFSKESSSDRVTKLQYSRVLAEQEISRVISKAKDVKTDNAWPKKTKVMTPSALKKTINKILYKAHFTGGTSHQTESVKSLESSPSVSSKFSKFTLGPPHKRSAPIQTVSGEEVNGLTSDSESDSSFDLITFDWSDTDSGTTNTITPPATTEDVELTPNSDQILDNSSSDSLSECVPKKKNSNNAFYRLENIEIESGGRHSEVNLTLPSINRIKNVEQNSLPQSVTTPAPSKPLSSSPSAPASLVVHSLSTQQVNNNNNNVKLELARRALCQKYRIQLKLMVSHSTLTTKVTKSGTNPLISQIEDAINNFEYLTRLRVHRKNREHLKWLMSSSLAPLIEGTPVFTKTRWNLNSTLN
ncbi:hypothetical protein CROQUDRAFT_93734 [Cronartium quercuum f. sp. fusiforme G11]|uniref:Uncharacterized protein n=1 Tax=Cronartium quercuum f. sp. fusiforme G11 TaxID=708437 RepID=A0A9P6NES6_9BASI|nr:hypothetical protein CROQUDRAFT_93734 [Cronartium quercuum f. sp. fusiforme G11]